MSRHAIIFTASLVISSFVFNFAEAGDFCAYYTKLNSGEAWEQYSLTGKYADVVVSLGDGREFIFWRASSYLPHLKAKGERHYVEEIIPRSGDGTGLMPDRINQYSYVRIIENTPEKAVVHWRYMPDFNPEPDYNVTIPDFGNVDFDGVVHEVFTITADGKVVREIRQGREKLDEFNNAGNVTVETIQLGNNGIRRLSLNKGRLTKDVRQGIKGAALKTGAGSPIAEFKFDEGLKPNEDITIESISGTQCNIDGPATVWKRGVSGTALAFDGYWSKAALPMAQVPTVSDKLTVEAWIAPGAYSVSQWTGIVQHSEWAPVSDENYRFDGIEWGFRQLGEQLTEGYFLGIDESGHIGFQVMAGEELKKLVSESTAELYKWTHIAGTFGNGKMSLYINGEPVKSVTVDGTIKGCERDLIIGKSDDRIKYVPRHTVRPFSTFGSDLSFEGLIDEVRIHGECLSAEDISKSYESMKPDGIDVDMEPRILPGNPGESKSFGASYTKLKFHELWDNMWRTSKWPDILVKFDEMPTSILFWRGTRYGASYVTENNRWMSDQSNELTDWRWDNKPTGCNSTCEHMMDAQLRYGHVRMIENSPARVVVHWRYASNDANYKHTNWNRTNKWGSWIDEYYTIYPDGALVRYIEHNGCLDYYFEVPETPHFSALQVLNPPGEMPEDQLEEKAVTIADLEGKTRSFGLDGGNTGGLIGEPSVMTVNYKSDYKVYVAYNRAELIKTPWGWEGWWEGIEGDEEESEEAEEEEEDVDSPRETGLVSKSPLITGPWNHWPISQFRSDGRDCTALDRVGSAELNAGISINAVQAGAMIMFGLTNEDITSLVPMVKAWNYPAPVRNAGEMSSLGYDKTQRAYVFKALSDEMSFMLAGSEERPIVKPCFVVKNWLDRSVKAKLKINGEELESGPDFRQGVVIDTDGIPMLVIWLDYEATKMTKFELKKN